jgi:DNA-binding IclR family transcriptional regulator
VGADALFADGIEGGGALRVALRTGARIPPYCTSGGKAMLAALPDAAVLALHSGGLRPWPYQRLRTLDDLTARGPVWSHIRNLRVRSVSCTAHAVGGGLRWADAR